MVSINSTASNSAVLASLRQTNKDITESQTRIGTGLKINGASDGAAAWTMAQSIRSDIKYQSTLNGTISVAKAQIDSAVAGLDQINKLLGKIQELGKTAVNLTDGDTADAGVVKQINSLNTQITAIIKSTYFEGKNFLVDTSLSSVQIGKDVNAKLDVQSESVATGISALTTGIAALAPAAINSELDTIVTAAATAIDYVNSYQANLSNFSSTLESQVDFLNTLDTIKNSALSSIVDADMEKESARISALQVKQQLAYQALSIGNSSSQNILRLFQ